MECGSQCQPAAWVRAERTPWRLTAAHSFDFEPVQKGAALKSFSDLSRGAESSAERHVGQVDWAPRKPSSPAPRMPACLKGSPVFPTFPREEHPSFPPCFATGQSCDSWGGLISVPGGHYAGSRPLLHLAEGSRPGSSLNPVWFCGPAFPCVFEPRIFYYLYPEVISESQNTLNEQRRVVKSYLSVLLALASPQGHSSSPDAHPPAVMKGWGAYRRPASGGPGLLTLAHSPSTPTWPWDEAVSIQSWCLSQMETLDCNPLFYRYDIEYYYLAIIWLMIIYY